MNIDEQSLSSFREEALKLLPSFQLLISIRENLSKRTVERKGRDAENDKGMHWVAKDLLKCHRYKLVP